MYINRRSFLKSALLATGMFLLPLSNYRTYLSGWAATTENTNINKPRLIVIFLRGAIDGLSVVIPYGDSYYYKARPKIAIPKPNQLNGCLDLDGYFGLHPALKSLMPFWKEKSLAFVHACGSPNDTRSHFDAQDYMESGTPGVKATTDGWMNRLLGILPNHSRTQGVSFTENIPRIFSGHLSVSNISLGRSSNQKLASDRPDIRKIFDSFYSGNDVLSTLYKNGVASREELLSAVNYEQKMANNGAPLPYGFAGDATQLASAVLGDPRIELAFIDLGGWDTHFNQGASEGQLANHLKPLGEGLANLATGLKSIYANTTIMVVSEFGRTVHENGDDGTDHGHGNVMWLMGGPIKGEKVYTHQWKNLADENLYQNRDLNVTTDFRSVISSVLKVHFKATDQQLAHVFPEFKTIVPLQNNFI